MSIKEICQAYALGRLHGKREALKELDLVFAECQRIAGINSGYEWAKSRLEVKKFLESLPLPGCEELP